MVALFKSLKVQLFLLPLSRVCYSPFYTYPETVDMQYLFGTSTFFFLQLLRKRVKKGNVQPDLYSEQQERTEVEPKAPFVLSADKWIEKKNNGWNLELLKRQNIHTHDGNRVDCSAAADNSSWVWSHSHKLDSNKIIWICSGVSLVLQPALIHLSQKSDFLRRFLQSF